MLESVQATLNRTENDDIIALSLSLTVKDILCEIAELTTLETYDFFNLTLYRSTPCDDITTEQFNESSVAAAEKRGKELL